MLGLFKKTFKGLEKTRKKVSNAFSTISKKSYLDEDDFEMLEDCLYQAGNVERGLVFLSKPFCNYKITDFYIENPVFWLKNNLWTTQIVFFTV